MKNILGRAVAFFVHPTLAKFSVLAITVGITAVHAQSYNITDLGAVVGDSTSMAFGLNNLGQAAGYSSSPSGGVATLFSHGSATSLGTLGGTDQSFAEAINASGEVAGYDFPSSGISQAFIYSNGRMKDIHSATLFPFGTTATGINSLGQVVGYGWTTSANSHPFLFTGTAMIDLGTSGGPDGTALAISDAGQVVGNLTALNGSSHGFLYANGTMVDLGVPSGATSSTANAINVHSRIVGTLTVGGSSHAASWSGGVWTDLGVLPGATLGTMATGINASGQIVGVAIFPAIYARHGGRGITHVGFIILNGAPVDLDTLIPAGSGFTITGATAINDSGDILCNAISSSKSFRAVLLTPR